MEKPAQIKTYLANFLKYINLEFSKDGCEHCIYQEFVAYPYNKEGGLFTYCKKYNCGIAEPSTSGEFDVYDFDCEDYIFNFKYFDDEDQCYFFDDETYLEILKKLKDFIILIEDWQKYLEEDN